MAVYAVYFYLALKIGSLYVITLLPLCSSLSLVLFVYHFHLLHHRDIKGKFSRVIHFIFSVMLQTTYLAYLSILTEVTL